jgi:hypothetical protein
LTMTLDQRFSLALLLPPFAFWNRSVVGPESWDRGACPPTRAMAASRDWDRACLPKGRRRSVARLFPLRAFLSLGPVVHLQRWLKRWNDSLIGKVGPLLAGACSGTSPIGRVRMSLPAGTSACARMRDLCGRKISREKGRECRRGLLDCHK